MTDLVLACRGFELGRSHVPTFEVRRGCVLTLQLPARFDSIDRLASHLSGTVPRTEVDVRGRCVVAERAQPPHNWRRWFSDPFPGEWLIRRGFTKQEATTIVAKHCIDDRHRLSQYAATPRTLLGLEAAYHLKPDLVIFDTSGLDPLGELAVYDLVRSNLHRISAIYLATSYLSEGVIHNRAMPGSDVFELTTMKPVTI